jgi:ankyrin repeat protein
MECMIIVMHHKDLPLTNISLFRFMWVQFQIVAICKERTQGDIYKAIGSLPKDLDATYSRIIHGLKSQGESISTVAEKVLKWIYFAVKPSSPDTIIQSLAVKPNEAVPDLKPLEWTLKKVLAACQNLVIFDETLKILRFAHFSVQEYLQRQPEFSEETGHAYMADICLTLLTYDSEGINGCQLPELERYAVKYWGSHARLSGLSTVDRCMELLNNPTVYRAWCHRAAPEDEELRATLSNGGPPTPTPTPFWVACYYGLPHVLERLDQSQVNAENLGGKTPLIAASWQQHEVIVRMLLDIDGVDVNKANRRGSPMSWVARNGNQDILKMLLAVDGVNVNKSDQYGMTPLSLATQHGHEKIVATLLAVDRVNVNKANPTNETPLSWAAHRGHKKIVAMLLAVDGVDVNAETTAGETPLIRAVYPGYEKIVAMLLAADGVNVNAKSKTGRTPLWVAANTGREKILTMLLAVDGVNVNAKNEDGHTALSRALTNGYQEIARLLRAAGASETGDA